MRRSTKTNPQRRPPGRTISGNTRPAPSFDRQAIKAAAIDLARRQLASEFAAVFQGMKADYLAETGRPMPTTIDEMIVEARVAGWSAAEAEAGEYTLAAIQRQSIAKRQAQAGETATIAAAVVERMQAADPLSVADKYQRAAQAMSSNARRIVACLSQNHARMESDAITRRDLADETGLSDPQVKAAIEHELRRVEAQLGATIIESKPSRGTWLSPEGVEVAKRIDAKILKK